MNLRSQLQYESIQRLQKQINESDVETDEENIVQESTSEQLSKQQDSQKPRKGILKKKNLPLHQLCEVRTDFLGRAISKGNIYHIQIKELTVNKTKSPQFKEYGINQERSNLFFIKQSLVLSQQIENKLSRKIRNKTPQ